MHKKRKTSGVHISSRKPTKKVYDENEENNKETEKKRRTLKNVFNGRKWFISHMSGTGETNRHKMLVDDS